MGYTLSLCSYHVLVLSNNLFGVFYCIIFCFYRFGVFLPVSVQDHFLYGLKAHSEQYHPLITQLWFH